MAFAAEKHADIVVDKMQAVLECQIVGGVQKQTSGGSRLLSGLFGGSANGRGDATEEKRRAELHTTVIAVLGWIASILPARQDLFVYFYKKQSYLIYTLQIAREGGCITASQDVVAELSF